MADKQDRKRGPPPTDFGSLPVQGIVDVGSNTIDVNMQLVLRAPELRIYRQAESIAGHRAPEGMFDQAARLPRCCEVIDCAGREDRAAFNAADLFCRYQQKLRRSVDVFEDCNSSIDAPPQIDLGARPRITMLLFVRPASTVHDVLQRVRVGLRRGSEQSAVQQLLALFNVCRDAAILPELEHKQTLRGHGRSAAFDRCRSGVSIAALPGNRTDGPPHTGQNGSLL